MISHHPPLVMSEFLSDQINLLKINEKMLNEGLIRGLDPLSAGNKVEIRSTHERTSINPIGF